MWRFEGGKGGGNPSSEILLPLGHNDPSPTIFFSSGGISRGLGRLCEAAVVPSRTTGQKALKELLSEGKIQRIGKGTKGKPFRYFGKRGEQ